MTSARWLIKPETCAYRWWRQTRLVMERGEKYHRQGGASSDVEAALEQHLLSQLRQQEHSNLLRWQWRSSDCSWYRNVRHCDALLTNVLFTPETFQRWLRRCFLSHEAGLRTRCWSKQWQYFCDGRWRRSRFAVWLESFQRWANRRCQVPCTVPFRHVPSSRWSLHDNSECKRGSRAVG